MTSNVNKNGEDIAKCHVREFDNISRRRLSHTCKTHEKIILQGQVRNMRETDNKCCYLYFSASSRNFCR